MTFGEVSGIVEVRMVVYSGKTSVENMVGDRYDGMEKSKFSGSKGCESSKEYWKQRVKQGLGGGLGGIVAVKISFGMEEVLICEKVGGVVKDFNSKRCWVGDLSHKCVGWWEWKERVIREKVFGKMWIKGFF